MSEHDDSVPANATTHALKVTTERIAGGFINALYRVPARLVCPSDEVELAVVDAMARAAAVRGIPVEVVDLRPAPAERLDAITAQLDEWRNRATDNDSRPTPTLLIRRGFDIFGDYTHDGPTYPLRSKFQFDQKFLWLFIGRYPSRMRFLFDSYQRPLYRAAGDITPEDWQH